MDLVEYLTRYPQDVTLGDEAPETVFDRYHAPEVVVRSDGIDLDRERLLQHVRPARKRVSSVHTEVRDALNAGKRIAARYTLTAVMRKGQTVTTEIFMFGELADDGRLLRVEQVTRTAQPAGAADQSGRPAEGIQ
ncbi:hypothetical protein ACPPVO_20855 [Dactylosporangium sp. McL0621]|uniref:hypothetical protein n=1 Tax=Dactylosporangium sp. McL0621 TaxID=3415678 RepID=UPI003CF8D0F0